MAPEEEKLKIIFNDIDNRFQKEYFLIPECKGFGNYFSESETEDEIHFIG